MALSKTSTHAAKAIEDFEKNLQDVWTPKKESIAKFLILGELADKLEEEFGVNNISIAIDASTMTGKIGILTDEIILEGGRTHQFFQYIKAADRIRFSNQSGSLLVRLYVDRLWVKDEF